MINCFGTVHKIPAPLPVLFTKYRSTSCINFYNWCPEQRSMKKIKQKISISPPDAKSTMGHRKNETNIELAKIYNSKKFKNIRKKATLTLEQKQLYEKEQVQNKESAKHIDNMLMEIEKRELDSNSVNVLSTPHKKLDIPKDSLNEPVIDEINNYRHNVLDKQKKYWG